MNLDAMKVDLAKVESGTWVELGQYDARLRGVGVLMRGFDNRDDRRIVSKALRSGTGEDEEGEAAFETMSKRLRVCLLDWRGLTDEHGQPKPFSAADAERYIGREFPFFRRALIAAAADVAEGRAKEIEAAAGN